MAEPDDPFQHTRMTLGEHLRELRTRLFRSVIAVAAALIVCFAFYEPIFDVVVWPMRQVLHDVGEDQRDKYEALLAEERAADPSVPRSKYFQSDDPGDRELRPEFATSERMAFVGVGESMMVMMRTSFIASLALAMPLVLWQMWQFISAGLYPHERRAVLMYFPISIGLFVSGVLFGYFVMCPIGFRFMVTVFSSEDVQYIPSVGPYLDWLQGITVALGLVFELPLLMFVLVRTGLVERRTFARFRPYFAVAAFVIGGVLTPPDPVTQFLAAVPMILLYEAGLLWTWFLPIAREERARKPA